MSGGSDERVVRAHPVAWVGAGAFAVWVTVLAATSDHYTVRISLVGALALAGPPLVVLLGERLIVTEDRVVIVGLFRRRSVERSRVKAVRSGVRGLSWLEIEPTKADLADPWLSDHLPREFLPAVFAPGTGHTARSLGIPSPDAYTVDQLRREWAETSAISKGAGVFAVVTFAALLVAHWLGLLPE